jgi:hypothetical protein
VQFELTDQTRESVAAWITRAKLRRTKNLRADAIDPTDLPAKG